MEERERKEEVGNKEEQRRESPPQLLDAAVMWSLLQGC
ncbi:hypothetical protein ACP70R_015484 [Stipagrostis hirtigluma subsp. patula]